MGPIARCSASATIIIPTSFAPPPPSAWGKEAYDGSWSDGWLLGATAACAAVLFLQLDGGLVVFWKSYLISTHYKFTAF